MVKQKNLNGETKELLKDQIAKKKTETISIRLPADLMERFKDYCTNQEIKPNTLLKEMISDKVNTKFIYRGSYKPAVPINIYLPAPFSDYITIMRGFDLTEEPYEYMENLIINDVMVGNYDLLDIITLSTTNNELDVWTEDGYKAKDSRYEHEGLIIYPHEVKEDTFIYLINVFKNKNSGYYCRLVTINQAIGLAEYVGNFDLEVTLELIKGDKKQFSMLIENNLDK